MHGQFVIHLHSGFGEEHYDLMLSYGNVLATWQLRESPLGMKAGQEIPALRLADHRIEYLTYQGPVSQGRGKVTMLDKGNYELVKQSPTRWELQVKGEQIAGHYELVRENENTESWIYSRLTDSETGEKCGLAAPSS